MLKLLQQVVRRSALGEPVAVCVVARTRGSTPQKAGAMMLVLRSGHTLGTLGGGCIEAEVRRRALELSHAPQNRLLSFRLDHDYGWDDGLVCGGVMEIAVQVVATMADALPWGEASETLAAGQASLVRIEVVSESGERVTIEHEITPSPTLVIAGAGHVGMALATVAQQMEFDVVVIDDREDCASPDRFPRARRIVGEIDTELRRLAMHEQSYVVIVTRGHRHDARALDAVVASDAKYVGLIGSRRKIITILESLRNQGVPAERLSRVHAPIGLEIGAVTPGEIAVSIAAELVAVRRGATIPAAASMRLTARQAEHALSSPDIGDVDARA